MALNQSIINNKRRDWKKEIRREQLENTFSKRRAEFSANLYKHDHEGVEDNQKISVIMQLIASFSYEIAFQIIRNVISIDKSLSMLFQITGMIPQNVPQIVLTIINESLTHPIAFPQNIDLNQYWNQPEWAQLNSDKIQRLKELIKQLEAQETLEYIISMVNRLQDINCAIRRQVICFLCFIMNVLAIGCWVQDRTGGTEKKTVIFRHLQSCKFIIINMLAGPDELVCPFVQEVLYSTGGNIKFIDFYFNMFLINGPSSRIKIDLLKYFTMNLAFNSETFLQDHKQMVFILSNGMQGLGEIDHQFEQQYLSMASKLVYLLGAIMQVLNLRYESSRLYQSIERVQSDKEDCAFVLRLSFILKKLAKNKFILRNMMTTKSISQLILNHMKGTGDTNLAKVAFNFLQILILTTQDQMSVYSFMEEPRYFKKTLNILQWFLDCQHTETSPYKFMLLNQALFILSNCSSYESLLLKMVKEEIFKLVNRIYFETPKTYNKETKVEWQYIFLNLLIGIKNLQNEHWQESYSQLDNIFAIEENRLMFIDLIEHNNENEILYKAIGLIKYYCMVSDRDRANSALQNFLDSRDLFLKLEQVNKLNLQVCQNAMEGMICLQNRLKKEDNNRQSDQFY